METPGNSPQKREPKKRVECSKEQREEVNAFFSKLEVGDLCFMDKIEYGLALFGQTKAGKTTFAHHLIQNPLRGTKDNTYQLDGGTRFKEAVIGHQSVSQTEIPNQIVNSVGGAQMHILDCPGYSDSKGCFMVIANGYFHYRIFSKVKNLKFVITFDYEHFGGVFDKPKNTLIEFFMAFKNFEQIGEQVINATSFVFTKLKRYGQNDETINGNIEAKLKSFRNCGNIENSLEYRDFIRQLIDSVIDNKRYYFFERAEEGRAAPTNTLLQTIHSRTGFWSRSIKEGDSEVDMRHIQMTLGERTRQLAQKSTKFKQDFDILTSQFKSRFERALLSRCNTQLFRPECSLQRITVQFLTNSILGSQKQHSFFTDYILQFEKAFNIYKTNQFNSKRQYEEKRAQIKRKIMEPCQTIDNSQVQCIQKLQICKLIIAMVQNNNYTLGESHKDQRTLESYKQLSKEILKILVQFRKIRFFRNSQPERSDYEQKLDEFNYIVHRLLQEARTFKIIFSTAMENAQFAVQNLDITQVLYDFIQSLSDENYDYIKMNDAEVFEKCRVTYLANHLEIAADEPDYYYTEIEKYFGNVKYNQTPFARAAAERLLALGMAKLKLSKFKNDKREKVATYLNALRNHHQSIDTGDLVAEQYDQEVQLYLDALNMLANQLLKFDGKENNDQAKKAIRCAFKLFDSISNTHKSIEAYRSLAGKTQGLELKNILTQFAEYAARHGRIELAIENYQHAFSLVEQSYPCGKDGFYTLRKKEREEIAGKIGMLGMEKKHSPSQAYFDALLRKKLFQLVDPSLLDEIETIDFGKKSK